MIGNEHTHSHTFPFILLVWYWKEFSFVYGIHWLHRYLYIVRNDANYRSVSVIVKCLENTLSALKRWQLLRKPKLWGASYLDLCWLNSTNRPVWSCRPPVHGPSCRTDCNVPRLETASVRHACIDLSWIMSSSTSTAGRLIRWLSYERVFFGFGP